MWEKLKRLFCRRPTWTNEQLRMEKNFNDLLARICSADSIKPENSGETAKWFDVNECLPPTSDLNWCYSVRVQVKVNGDVFACAARMVRDGAKQLWIGENGYVIWCVTHWRRLPETATFFLAQEGSTETRQS